MTFGALAVLGVILGTTYMVWLYYRLVCKEVNPKIKHLLYDIDLREVIALIPLAILVFFIGVQPGTLLSYMHASVQHLLESVNSGSGMEIKIAENILEIIK
jgi:NADH-quinone oxidoreductase subunit M